MSPSPEQVRQIYAEADCLYDRAQVEQALSRMAKEITARIADKNPLVLTVMSGALIPAGILLSQLDFPLHIDYIHASRYRGDTAGGDLQWRVAPRFEVTGRCVLIVDDILDEGLTLQAIIKWCWEQGANEVYSAVLVEKKHARNVGVDADFIGIEIPDRYVFGYGMDYKECLRNAPGIFAVKGH
ncbi:MAG: hypoxanthine-guanine phosphoribosyltransferase [Gammaproteobacteria bacterium]|nr:hypoxanthine-guanine phosphoribosyltransferase [Gammaproteobacteria bacterium]